MKLPWASEEGPSRGDEQELEKKRQGELVRGI